MSDKKIQNPTVGVQSIKSQKQDHYHLTNRDLAFSRAMPCLRKKSVKSKKKLTQGAKNWCMNNGVYLLMNILWTVWSIWLDCLINANGSFHQTTF